MDNLGGERRKREAAFFDAEAEKHRGWIAPFDPLALARYRDPLRRRFAVELRLRTVGDLRGKRVLDVGCGEGLESVMLAKLGAAEVVGIDISKKSIAQARRRASVDGVADRVRFLCAPIETAELPPAAFDLVWCNAILHHVTQDLDRVMRQLSRWVKPDGLLSFAEPIAPSRALRRLRMIVPLRAGEVTPDERPLEPRDLAIVKRHVPDLEMRTFGLFGRLDPFLLANYEHAPWWKKAAVNATAIADWVLLSVPGVDRLATVAVMWGHAARVVGKAAP
jgi:2-polyprenyl-3-methyl-5-hydroxy-6-metoxy-1,4-benzoquinol methylase